MRPKAGVSLYRTGHRAGLHEAAHGASLAARLLHTTSDARSPASAVEELVVPALDLIGRAWEAGDVALSQVYMSARICEELVAAVPELATPFRPDRPRLAMAALEDHHLLGKRLVLSMLRASGFAAADYGVIEAPALAARAHADRIDVLLVSVLILRLEAPVVRDAPCLRRVLECERLL
jgi:methanogenic corrinoid protein MtbC1